MKTFRLTVAPWVFLATFFAFGCGEEKPTGPEQNSTVEPPTLDKSSVYKTSSVQEKTLTGFYYPTGTSNLSNYAGWLALGCKGATAYESNKYHLGKDIAATNVGDLVYAIADGEVAYFPSKNGWEFDNIALVIKHTLANGEEFLAIYGHIKSKLNRGDKVIAGQSFATIGPFPSNKHHLHFGIHLSLAMPANNWGKMPCSNWPITNGFVAPIVWITTQTPALSSGTDPLDQQAIRDMENWAARNNRFLSAIPSTFGKNVNWSSGWELRWMNFNFTGNRIVRMYHATSKSNSSIRYTNFFDPDTNSWSGWQRVS